ncbi:MAG: DUF4382 domain-containing protein [Thaumarchaeota archaeon]|nr:DUF4382 domain-containing protein [Nitrososphaerota archaeon]
MPSSKVIIGAVVAVILALSLAAGAMLLAPPGSSSTTSNSTGTNQTSTSQSSTSSGAQSSTQSTTTSGILGQSGTMNIYLTDAPPATPQFKYLLVNVSSVVLRYEGNVSASPPTNQWVYNVNSTVGTNVNLTSLVNSSVLLGATKVPAGNVTEIILQITGARAYFTDGNSTQLKVVANGKLMVPINFTVNANGAADVTVDITPNSIHLSHGSTPVLTPVIHVTVAQSNQSTTTTVSATTTITETGSTTTSSTTTSTSSTTTSSVSSTTTSSTSGTSTTTTESTTSTTSTTSPTTSETTSTTTTSSTSTTTT